MRLRFHHQLKQYITAMVYPLCPLNLRTKSSIPASSYLNRNGNGEKRFQAHVYIKLRLTDIEIVCTTTWGNTHFSYFEQKKNEIMQCASSKWISSLNEINGKQWFRSVCFCCKYFSGFSIILHAFKMRFITIKKRELIYRFLCVVHVYLLDSMEMCSLSTYLHVRTYTYCVLCGYTSGPILSVYFTLKNIF